MFERRENRGDLDVGPCHSCDNHLSSWCAEYGVVAGSDESEATRDCISFSGCTWMAAEQVCVSSQPEAIVEEIVCETLAEDEAGELATYTSCLADAGDLGKETQQNGGCKELYFYEPQCLEYDATLYASMQGPDALGHYFCVDENGHEIPDTRKQRYLPDVGIDCDKARMTSGGFQCPNAITLTTKGGVVVVNEDNDGQDCKVHCNTDTDCRSFGNGNQWCCFNGCGYQCKEPVLPLQGCAAIPTNHPGQMVHAPNDRSSTIEAGSAQKHEMQIVLACLDGWDVIPVSEQQSLTLECKHGNWEYCDENGECGNEYSLDCQERCEEFVIEDTPRSILDDLQMRERDFKIHGTDNYFGSTRKISCAREYGVVAGSDYAKREKEETLTCIAGGVWRTEDDTDRTIECSVCFDDGEWRDERGNACVFYESRPLECLPGEGEDASSLTAAQEKCRVSCRTCLQAEKKFKRKEKRIDLEDISADNKSQWKRIRSKVLKEKTWTHTESVEVVVQTLIPASEACSNGAENVRKVDGACPDGYTPLE